MNRDKYLSGASGAPDQRQSVQNQPHGLERLWQLCSLLWQQANAFMVHSPEVLPLAEGSDRGNYEGKARFYAYLPPLEEQRDWLEKIYRKSS